MQASPFIQYGHFTHKGNSRAENQDAVLCAPHHGLWVVADGMGGHAHGQYASQTIIRTIAQITEQLPASTKPIDLLSNALAHANRDILNHAHSLGPNQIVGSTVVILFLHEDQYHILWAGDSRCYLLREETLSALTQDHADPYANNVLTNAVGVNPDLVIDYQNGILYEEDYFLLCSDGLYNIFDDRKLETKLRQSSPPRTHCEGLLSQALKTGANDNLSAILIKIGMATET